MARVALAAVDNTHRPPNTGDSTEFGIDFKTLVDNLNTMFLEIYGGITNTGVTTTTLTAQGGFITQTAQIGATTTAQMGFFGNTPISRPSGTSQSAISTGQASAVTLTGTTTNAVGFTTQTQMNAWFTAINAIITQLDQVGSLGNALRAALTMTGGLGLIKGSV